jgi:hypothetical protein
MRQREGKRIVGRRRRKVHRWCWNRPGELAVLRMFGEKFCRVEGGFAREKKRI